MAILTKDMRKKVKDVSKTFGVPSKDIIERAVLLYLEQARKVQAFRMELDAWDSLSDEALVNFEQGSRSL